MTVSSYGERYSDRLLSRIFRSGLKGGIRIAVIATHTREMITKLPEEFSRAVRT